MPERIAGGMMTLSHNMSCHPIILNCCDPFWSNFGLTQSGFTTGLDHFPTQPTLGAKPASARRTSRAPVGEAGNAAPPARRPALRERQPVRQGSRTGMRPVPNRAARSSCRSCSPAAKAPSKIACRSPARTISGADTLSTVASGTTRSPVEPLRSRAKTSQHAPARRCGQLRHESRIVVARQAQGSRVGGHLSAFSETISCAS